MTKAEAVAAFEAGKHSLSIVWGPDATDEQRQPGMHHCPFSTDQPEERAEWARGLEEALGGDRYDPAKILREIRDEIKAADSHDQ